ncbi:hypothetical protein N7490_012132 [Penicillium lividum]|nr:hypothetical protein N7490_012132 [Penicillium lividum]
MSQSASDASWPAAIPGIHLHPTDLSRDELPEEAKGWLLFVKEEGQLVLTPEDGLRQRRALIEKWATASQEFREHPFDGAGAGNAPRYHIPEFLNLATPIALSDILSELYLASADFHALSMTRSGTVVFADGPDYTWYVIDEPGLTTGRITVAEFGSNGSVRDSTIRRAWNMGQIMSFGQNLGRRVVDLAMSAIGGPPQYNEPLDML